MSRERVYTKARAKEGEGLVQQHQASEANINTIMARWSATGELPHQTGREPRYGDFSNAQDYLSACNAVNAAEQAFNSLPAKIRSRFANDPSRLLEFVYDEKQPRGGN